MHHLPSLNTPSTDPSVLENIITQPLHQIPKVIQSVFGNHESVPSGVTTSGGLAITAVYTGGSGGSTASNSNSISSNTLTSVADSSASINTVEAVINK